MYFVANIIKMYDTCRTKLIMNITFQHLKESHFPLMLKWLELPHIKKWWDQDIIYNLEKVYEKYAPYVHGYKNEGNVDKPVFAYIINASEVPIGYIQLYNAYDFPRGAKLEGLPENLGAFDIFIGEEEYLGKNIGSLSLQKFLHQHGNNYSHIFVDPTRDNIAAIKSYEKAGFIRLEEQKYDNEVWMLRENILNELIAREPIFHHPEKFGKSEQDIMNLMCEEFYEVGASGTLYTKHDVIKTLLERYNDPSYHDIWETKDFSLTQIAQDNYLLKYTLIQNKTRVTRRSTIWCKIDGQWKILYHQGTIYDGGQK